ncbi:MAG: NAD-dependent epimerase/dehydratase family protein, partial [Pseudomonadota bacterium]
VTGAAGFIGSHVAHRLLARGEDVIGLDNLNSYYDPELKRARLKPLEAHPRFTMVRGDLADAPTLKPLRQDGQIDRIVHLAAQAGVRFSLENPRSYAESNLVGHTEILELARHLQVKHLVYASSSSVYGSNSSIPFKETDSTDHPISFYGASKKACEVLSASYAHLFKIPQTGLRFFTVYGPWGRPDMAYMIFAKNILAGQPINVFGEGQMARDFTYIDDVVDGVVASLDRPPALGDQDAAPHVLYNLGNDQPEELGVFIDHMEKLLQRPAVRHLKPMQPGDVRRTWANIDAAKKDLGYQPKVPLAEGLKRFVAWYTDYTKA